MINHFKSLNVKKSYCIITEDLYFIIRIYNLLSTVNKELTKPDVVWVRVGGWRRDLVI